ncbi:hypothetical protein M8A51_15325 [Schlegelella sp. S2-27]|uniref:Uncharacterized protein n=1 Tax=Caldimonas mangrovi TaxID=2944811 RepID=A0ABT0YRZ2_9BURK|nr:hypothetical protein [Caldimonas mangrovi]MCM5680896.1 hypothetical protein [Caldimonas mangrovi]
MFDSAQDRILYSQAVDYIEQGRSELVPRESLDAYLQCGLLQRSGTKLELTETGRREYMVAKNERSTDG